MQRLHRCSWAAVFVAVGLLVGCTSREDRFENHLARANEFAQKGAIDSAILEYRSALKLVPESVEVNEKLADQLLRKDDPSAVFYLEEVVRLDPERIDVAMRLAHVLLATDRMAEAEPMIEAALVSHPESSAVHRARAELFLYKNDPEAALDSARKATDLAPDDPLAWLGLGRVHVGMIRMAFIRGETPQPEWYEEAAAAFQRSDDAADGMVVARIEKARILGAQKETRDQVRPTFESAVALANEQGDDYLRMLAATATEAFAAEAKMLDLQRWALRQMIEVNDGLLHAWRKLVLLSDDSTDPGPEGVYAELLDRRPDDAGAHVAYVTYLIGVGRRDDARVHIQEVVEAGTDSPLPYEQLVRLLIHRRQYATARDYFVQMAEKFPEDPVSRRTEARFLLAQRRSGEAAMILRALAAKSNTYETQRLLATAEYRNGNLPNALAAIDRAIALRPGFSPEAVRLKAKIHHDSKEWAAVLRSLTEIVQAGAPVNDMDRLLRARAFYGTGQPELGIRVLEQILNQPEPLVPAAVEFARLEGENHPDRAAAYLDAALSRQPWNRDAVQAQVDMDLRAGRVEEAMACLDAAVESGKALPETLLLRAYVLTRVGDLERAESDALRAFEANPSLPGGVALLYAIYRSQGRLDEARQSFEEADAAGVLHAGSRMLLGRIYLRQGETNRAVEVFEKILRDDPNMITAKNDLAYLLAVTNQDLDRALQLAEEAQQAMSSDPIAADTVGFVYYRRGLHEAALQQFEYALELNARHQNQLEPTLHYHRGLTLDALDRDDEAVASFRKALEIDSNFPYADDARKRLESAGQPVANAPRPS